MNKHFTQLALLAVVAFLAIGLASAAEPPGSPATPMPNADLDKLVGQPVDIAPWTYAWRADRAVQEKPEAYFIPRRLQRIDKVYRTARTALPPDQLKSNYYDMPDLLKPLPPPPKGRLQAGLLWTGGLSKYQVELHWPADVEVPSPESVEVRVYPTSFGWFGWTVDKVLAKPQVSTDRRVWTYKSEPGAKMDSAYNAHPDAATEMVAVFYEDTHTPARVKATVPSIGVPSPNVGEWKRIDLEIEWGFQAGTEKAGFDGHLESYVAMVGPASALVGDKGTTVTGAHTWQSRAAGDATRRGIVVPVLYAPSARPGLDSRVTVWTNKTGFTIRLRDLDDGPILIPQRGVFVTKAGSGKTARQFAAELAAKKLKGVCQMTRERREAASWDEVMREVRLSTCPAGTPVPPFPKVPDPPMQVHLSDTRWTDAWRAASHQLRGRHMWGGLAFEVGRVAHEMDMVGLHDEADKVYQHFLKSPGVKPDGDFADGRGALEWATSMRHDMGYSHDGTHSSTGRVLFAMADRYFLTGDKAWFQRNRERMQAAADWIIRQRNTYMKDVPNRQDLLVAGLMPPYMLGDYAIPSCDWHWYYVDDALSLQAIRRFADALVDFDPEAGRKYRDEAEAFRRDLRRVMDREAALAPVRLGRDGAYHSFLPRMAYTRGLTGPEIGAPQFPDCDWFVGALPLAEPFVALDANDTRMVDTINAMTEMETSADGVRELEAARKQKGLSAEDAWFWSCRGVRLPKATHNANIFLLQDDVPNFLRYWTNSYAAMVGANGLLWEAGHLGGYADCDAPDNGTAGWFLENFRNLLVMEEGQSLWLARATPRAWLEQGKKIAINNAPSYFGPVAYEIVSDVDHGKITATVKVPSRQAPSTVLVRFRHPKAAAIKSATVNGKPWTDFDPAKETVRLPGVQGTVQVEAGY
jgi:hypothetical protein